MAKYKLEEITSQADLDKVLKAAREEAKEESKSNYSDAAERMQRKLEAANSKNEELTKELNTIEKTHETQIKELTEKTNEYEAALTEAYKANDTFVLTDKLNEAGIDPRYHDLVIQNGELNSDMEDEDFKAAIGGVLEKYPAFGIAEHSPLNAEDDEVDPVAAEDEEEVEFDTNKTFQ